jgi:hypothetical protein
VKDRSVTAPSYEQLAAHMAAPLAWAQDFAAMQSYLSPAAEHGRRPFDVLVELTSGNVWIPATG